MKKSLLIVIGALAIAASLTMYFIGKESSHLSELYDLFWIPLPLAAVALLAAFLQKKK